MRRKASLLNVGFRRSPSEMNSRFAHQSSGVTSLSDCFLVGSLIWAPSDTTFHWETVKTHAFAEVVCVAILRALALL